MKGWYSATGSICWTAAEISWWTFTMSSVRRLLISQYSSRMLRLWTRDNSRWQQVEQHLAQGVTWLSGCSKHQRGLSGYPYIFILTHRGQRKGDCIFLCRETYSASVMSSCILWRASRRAGAAWCRCSSCCVLAPHTANTYWLWRLWSFAVTLS